MLEAVCSLSGISGWQSAKTITQSSHLLLLGLNCGFELVSGRVCLDHQFLEQPCLFIGSSLHKCFDKSTINACRIWGVCGFQFFLAESTELNYVLELLLAKLAGRLRGRRACIGHFTSLSHSEDESFFVSTQFFNQSNLLQKIINY